MTPSMRFRAASRSSRPLDAEDLAIRFVNTAAWRLRDPIEERLASPEALVAWLARNQILGVGQVEEVMLRWRQQPAVAQAALDAAIGLREAIYGILISRLNDIEPPDAALARFNRFLCQSNPGPQIAWAAGELVWFLDVGSVDAAHLVMPVALSAAELMTGIRKDKVRQCQDDRGCGWLFVDESRAQNRRWCSMGDCGNRAKARRHYRRIREQPDTLTE